MITIIHGDDVVSSLKALETYKARYAASAQVTLDGRNLELTDLVQAAGSRDLFGTDEGKLVVVERYLNKGIAVGVFDWLSQAASSIALVFWEDHQLGSHTGGSRTKLLQGAQLLKKLQGLGKDVRILSFRSKLLFDFLESLYPGNLERSLLLSRETVHLYNYFELLPLLTGHIRSLLLTATNDYDFLSGLHPFRRQKLQSQQKKFTTSQLLKLYFTLFKWEIAEKLGRLPTDDQMAFGIDVIRFTNSQSFTTAVADEMQLITVIRAACSLSSEKNFSSHK